METRLMGYLGAYVAAILSIVYALQIRGVSPLNEISEAKLKRAVLLKRIVFAQRGCKSDACRYR